jgi:hypothetical protein
MSAVTFDTLKYVETLKVAGVPELQARAQSDALKEVLNTEVATKHDVTEMELKVEAKLEAMKYEIIKWNTGTLLAATGIFAAIVKFWH